MLKSVPNVEQKVGVEETLEKFNQLLSITRLETLFQTEPIRF